MKPLEIIIIFCVLFATSYICYTLYEQAEEELKYNEMMEKSMQDIREDIKPEMSGSEIQEVVKTNCERYVDSKDTYRCISKYYGN